MDPGRNSGPSGPLHTETGSGGKRPSARTGQRGVYRRPGIQHGAGELGAGGIPHSGLAGTWPLSGGVLAGTTEDAVSKRGVELREDAAVAGTVKEPSLEEILAMSPDFVVLSTDVAGQVKLLGALEAAIPHTQGGLV